MECEKCERPVLPIIHGKGCPACIRANEFGDKCKECIRDAKPGNSFPNFEQRVSSC